jgi:hypothetical protein
MPLPVGTEITVATNLGTVNPGQDVDGLLQGVQVAVSDGAGHFSFTVQRPAAPGSATITAAEVNGKATGSLLQPYSAALTERFDFIAGSDPGAAGFLPVPATASFTPAAGYGWATAVGGFDRGTAPQVTVNLYRAGAWNYGGSPGLFEVQAAATTTYSVRLYVGDPTMSWTNISLSINGGPPQTVSPTAGHPAIVTFTFTTDGTGLVKVNINTTGTAWVINGLDLFQGIVGGPFDPGAAPELAAGGVVTGTNVTPLTQGALQPVVAEAIRRWAAAGLTPTQVATLQAVTFQVGDLTSQGELGLASPMTITIDATAAGHGWFLASSSASDSVFGQRVAGELQALPGSVAATKMDLLTVVEHELGHELGLVDLSASAAPGDVMDGSLGVGVRRLPSAADVDATFTQPLPTPTPSPAPTPVPVVVSQPPSRVGSTVVTTNATTGSRARRLRHPRGRIATHRLGTAAKVTPGTGTTGQ